MEAVDPRAHKVLVVPCARSPARSDSVRSSTARSAETATTGDTGATAGSPLRTPRIARLRVGAQGGLYYFQVYATLTWTSVGLDQFALTIAVDQHIACVHNQILDLAHEVAEGLPAHHVVEMQTNLNKRLNRTFGPYPPGNGTLACLARVRVAPDPELQDRLAAHAKRLIDIENDHSLRVQRAQLSHDLAKEFRALLTVLRAHPMAAHANRLTDKDFADIIDAIGEDRGANTERLIRLLKEH